MSITYDEPTYWVIGNQVLQGDTATFAREFRKFRNIVPGTAFHVILAHVVRFVAPDSVRSSLEIISLDVIQVARFGGMLAGVALLLVVFYWTRELYGPRAATIATIFCAFDPTIIAHARVIHQNTLSTLGTTLCLFSLWRYLQKRTTPRFVTFCFCFAAVQLTRASAPLHFFFVISLWFVHEWRFIHRSIRERHLRALARQTLFGVGKLAVLVAAVLLTLNIAYGFDGSLTRLEDHDLMSDAFLKMADTWLGSVRLPLPAAYTYALDFASYKAQTGYGSGIAYAWGQLGVDGGKLAPIWWYYVFAIALKFPLGTLLIVLAAVGEACRSRRVESRDWFLLLPTLTILVSASLSTAQLGVRYVSEAIPLLIIFASRLLRGEPTRRQRHWAIVSIAAGTCVIVSTLGAFPDYIGYFNEVCSVRKHRYRFLVDSNLSWGQNDEYVRSFMESHPSVLLFPDLKSVWAKEQERSPERFFDPDQPRAGLVLIDVNRLVGIFPRASNGRWILERQLEPLDSVFGSHVLFDVRAEDLRMGERGAISAGISASDKEPTVNSPRDEPPGAPIGPLTP